MRIPNITNYKPKEFATLLNVTVKTLQRWDREKILVANRTPTNRRYYAYDQYLQFKGIEKDTDSRKIVLFPPAIRECQRLDCRYHRPRLWQWSGL